MKQRKVKTSNDGAAMVMVILIIAILIVFAFSLMLVSYTYYASQSKNVASKKCSEAANTLSLALVDELTDSNAPYKSALWNYLRYNLFQDGTWPYYDSTVDGHTEKEAFRYFNLKYNKADYHDEYGYDLPGFPGDVQLCVYWTPASDAEKKTTEHQSEISKKNAILYVEITCMAASQTYTVTNSYKLKVRNITGDPTEEDTKLINVQTLNQNNTSYNPLIKEINVREKWEWIETERN